MTAYHFRVGHVDEASELVKRHHYSGRPPGNIQCVGTWHSSGGLFGDYGEAVAACFFSIPPTRWAEDVWELSRLVRTDAVASSLTGLISATCGYIKKTGQADLLVSFADKTQDHHGGIYQAASWFYNGARIPQNDGLLVDGVFVPGRSCNSKWGTRSADALQKLLPAHTIEQHWDEGKHLYWRPLRRSGQKKASRLGLEALAYPKPDFVPTGAAAPSLPT